MEGPKEKKSAAQANETNEARGPALLKRHYERQTASRNPATSGRPTQSQEKECPAAPLCRRAARTKLSLPCRLFGPRITN